MNCSNCLARFSASMERELPSDQEQEFTQHLNRCEACNASWHAFERSHDAMRVHAPHGPRVGPAFTQAVMRRIRKEVPAVAPLRAWRRWGGLAAAALLIALGVKASISRLAPAMPTLSASGFRVIRALTSLDEPYDPGAPLNPGDIVVAERGGKIPLGGRIVGVGQGGIVWVPGDTTGKVGFRTGEPGASARDNGFVFALSDEHSVQVLSGSSGIAWSTTPAHRRRYLHELVDLSEGQDGQVALLAKDELRRLMAGGNGAAGPADGPALVMVGGNSQTEESYVMLPMFERSAAALGGPTQNASFSVVSRAISETIVLVGNRFLPASVARLLGRAPEEGI